MTDKSSHRSAHDNSFEKIQSFLEQDKVRVLFCFGPGGSGKSNLIMRIKESYDRSILTLAPTGIAAENISGITLHSAFGLKAEDFSNLKALKKDLIKAKNRDITLVLLDEASMVDKFAIRYLNWYLQHVNPNGKSKPFGGAKVILFGDQYQLPPINSEPSYCSKLFTKKQTRLMRLKSNFRQKDPKTQEALNLIRKGKRNSSKLKSALQYLNAKCVSERWVKNDGIIICPTNERVDWHNKKCLKRLTDRFQGEKTKYKNTRNKEIKLVPGARIIATRNNRRLGYYNGSLGTVVSCHKDGPVVRFDSIGQTVKVTNCPFSRGKKPGAALPLELGFAITIHKAQGQTFEKVHLDMKGRMFAAGQLYVALSRVRAIENLTISRELNLRDVNAPKAHVDALKRFKKWKGKYNNQ